MSSICAGLRFAEPVIVGAFASAAVCWATVSCPVSPSSPAQSTIWSNLLVIGIICNSFHKARGAIVFKNYSSRNKLTMFSDERKGTSVAKRKWCYVVSYFAVFLCGFAPLREPPCIKRQSHAKTPRRKDAQSQK